MLQLDSFRTFAVLAVVWTHTCHGTRSGQITSMGGWGVDLFFVLSGFLITGILLRARRQIEGSPSKRHVLPRVLCTGAS